MGSRSDDAHSNSICSGGSLNLLNDVDSAPKQ